ncbi:MAG: hypothetical protein GY838_08080 [bacterium]|nr:hypothetical protein [bacterium]
MRHRFIMTGTVLLCALPPLAELVARGWTVALRYFAGDAYLYLTVGRNLAATGRFTMDQVHATSGFHPLWQLVMGLLHLVANPLGLGKPAVIVLDFLLCLALVAAGLGLVLLAHRRAEGRLPVLVLLLPVGVMGLVLADYDSAFGPRGALWGYVNGMESGLTLLGYGLLAAVMVRTGAGSTRRGALGIGLVLAFLLVARLDNAFLVAAYAGVLGLRALLRRDTPAIRLLAWQGVPVVLVLLLYFAGNLATTGLLMPVSFLAKSGVSLADKAAEVRRALDENVLMFQWRYLQLVVPLAGALVALVLLRRTWREKQPRPLNLVFLVTAVATVATGLYHLLHVPTLAQGHWYFPVPALFLTWFLVDRLDHRRLRPVLDGWPAAAAVTVLTGWIFVTVYVGSAAWGPGIYERLLTSEADSLRAHYGDTPPRILSYEDGILAYATGWPVMTGRGYLLDREAVAVFRDDERSLFKLALDRGFDRVTVSPFHNKRPRFTQRSRSRQLASVLSARLRLSATEARGIGFAVDYISADGQFVILKMAPARRRAQGGPRGK